MQSAKKTKMKRVYVQLHRTVCYILWSINLSYLTTKYFAYDTDVDLGYYTPVTLTQPNLSLCFDLNTVLSGQKILMFNNDSPQFLGNTHKDIFDRTPSVDQVVKRCVYRDPVSDRMIQVDNVTECYRMFTIERYRMHCFICYLFHMNSRHNFSFNALAFSPNEPKFLFNVVIKGLLATGHSVAPLVHLDELADVDRMYMKELFPSKKDNELYHLEYDLYETERLPPPYSTRCGAEPQLRCLHNCLGEEYAKSGFTLINSAVRDTEEVRNLKVAQYNKNNNHKQNELRKKGNAKCAKRCNSEACRHKLLVTHLFGPFKSEHKLSFNVGSYRSPINLMRYSPKFSLADYVTQSLSLSGIWLGFSLVSIIYRRKRFDIIHTYNTWMSLKAKCKSLNRVFQVRMKNVSTNSAGKNNQRTRKMFSCILTAFKLVTLLIFTGQAFHLCSSYVKYETILKYHHTFDSEYGYRLPSTIICLSLGDLYSPRGRKMITEQNYEDVMVNKNTWMNLTLDQIFNQTMGEDLLWKCRVKMYGKDGLFGGKFQLKSKDECLRQDFTFHKYYSGRQLCYLFKPQELPENVRFIQSKQFNMVFGPINPSRLYSLVLNPKMKQFSRIDLILYFDAVNASRISSEFRAISPNLAERRAVILSFHTIDFEYLPPPYDTRCNQVVPTSECMNQCRASKLMRLNRLPYTNLVKEKQKKRLLSFQDLKNSSMNDLYWETETQCDKKCKGYFCHGNYTLTYSRHAIDRTEFDVEVVASPEANPRTHYWAVPWFEFYDFLYHMFCLLAFWLGFSFVGLNFIHSRSENRFNEAAKVLCSKTAKLLLRLRSFRVKILPGRANVLKRNLLMKRVICYSTCVLGMCFHLVLPVSDYLAYPTKLLTSISYEKPTPFKLIVCSETQDLFERGVLFGQNRQRKGQYVFDKNLDEILSEAKKLKHAMSACGYWGLSRDKETTNNVKKVTDRVFFESNNSSVCEEMFYSKVFLRQGNICLQYRLKRNTDWNRSQMLGSINAAKIAFSVSIKSSAISERFTVIAHFDLLGKVPVHSSIWATTVHGQPVNYRFVVSYQTFALEALPDPYSDKGFVSARITYCLMQCANGRVNRFNLTRIALGEQMPGNRLLCNSHRNNSFVGHLTNEIDRECDRNCLAHDSLRSLSDSYMITMISEPLPYEGEGSTRFDLRRTDDPVLTMKFLVDISLFDLIINIGSVISIWFGLSVINIPDLACKEDMEKLYIRTVDNLERTDCILRRVKTRRGTSRA